MCLTFCDRACMFCSKVVAFRSTDNGSTFEYTATLCNASDHRGCGECCNENHIVTLADGHTLMSVYRMGAGDGNQWLPYNASLGLNASCAAHQPPATCLPVHCQSPYHN